MWIVITEDLWWPLPESFGGGRSVLYDPDLVRDRNRLLQLGPGTEALVVRNKTHVDEELLTHFPDLKVVGRLGVGLDNIQLDACRRHGVQVIAAKGCNAASVAEYVFACMLKHARFLDRCDASVRSGTWDRGSATGSELFGKTLGLIGVGDIGARVASRARAFGMQVVAYDPFVLKTSALVQDTGIRLVELAELLEQSHYVSVHVPLTPQTHHLLSYTELAAMRSDSVLINTARGGIVDESALLKILREFPRRAAFLDVRETEPPGQDDPFRELTNVTLTPHVAGITRESSERVEAFVLEQVGQALEGHPVVGWV
ncbi:hydroxyacid dehydrogenase [Alicyclobacillus macrosporangiidus]|uniref:hydroxyacid dehydrogenase n=1 Tax=Alicyclobacillus macrosporangiidus TaxID=392015 RepID=UPI000495FBBF|nr:hydroxyacid dehydrogenase [Alicyclobacillus macrosporangiidus]